MTEPRFDELSFATPTAEGLAASYAYLHGKLDGGDVAGALAEWDALRRDYDSWSALVHLRFAQDTTDAEAKAAREYSDTLSPVATGHEVALKRRLLALPDRAAVHAVAGAHALRLWEMDITTFDPAIAEDLEEEAKLTAR
ncbi:MAG: peptidase, partial [Belnapia sp.]|nr:peptidase [Belnapia sp.]